MFHVKQGREPYATRSKAWPGPWGLPAWPKIPKKIGKGPFHVSNALIRRPLRARIDAVPFSVEMTA